jgi:hypothetical protein
MRTRRLTRCCGGGRHSVGGSESKRRRIRLNICGGGRHSVGGSESKSRLNRRRSRLNRSIRRRRTYVKAVSINCFNYVHLFTISPPPQCIIAP